MASIVYVRHADLALSVVDGKAGGSLRNRLFRTDTYG
jgi:hypothetical protein